MTIQIASGTGKGHTKLAAFDAALHEAGVANYNLIRLSSIIPPGSKIERATPISIQPGNWGDRLYVVMADMRVDTPNVEAWAGIGWVQDKKTGKGLFVEHEGANEDTVHRDIKASLEALQGIRRVDFGDMHTEVVGRTCTHDPVCALVIAVFQASDWVPKPDFEDVSWVEMMHELKQKMASHRASDKYIGVHIVADFWGCHYDDSGKELLKLITEAARVAGAEVLSSRVHEFEPAGTTAILLLGESHISIHTWPEYEYIAIDVFTCGHDMQPEFAIKYLEKKLKPTKTRIQVIDRGEK